MLRFERLPLTVQRECAVRVPMICASTYDGDADDAKLAQLIPIGGIRLTFDTHALTQLIPIGGIGTLPGNEFSIEIFVCEPCLNFFVGLGWTEIL